jgi:hypothetical protein
MKSSDAHFSKSINASSHSFILITFLYCFSVKCTLSDHRPGGEFSRFLSTGRSTIIAACGAGEPISAYRASRILATTLPMVEDAVPVASTCQ